MSVILKKDGTPNKRHLSEGKTGVVGAKKKNADDKVVLVQFYVKKGVIDRLGGTSEHSENLSIVRNWAKSKVETAKKIV